LLHILRLDARTRLGRLLVLTAPAPRATAREAAARLILEVFPGSLALVVVETLVTILVEPIQDLQFLTPHAAGTTRRAAEWRREFTAWRPPGKRSLCDGCDGAGDEHESSQRGPKEEIQIHLVLAVASHRQPLDSPAPDNWRTPNRGLQRRLPGTTFLPC